MPSSDHGPWLVYLDSRIPELINLNGCWSSILQSKCFQPSLLYKCFKGVMRLSMGTLNFPYYTRCFNCACRFLVADNLNQSTLSTEKRLIDCMVFNSVFTGISVISWRPVHLSVSFLTGIPHNILPKPLAAFPQNHRQINGQRWERNESCRNDYHRSSEKILTEPGEFNQRPPVLESCAPPTELFWKAKLWKKWLPTSTIWYNQK